MVRGGRVGKRRVGDGGIIGEVEWGERKEMVREGGAEEWGRRRESAEMNDERGGGWGRGGEGTWEEWRSLDGGGVVGGVGRRKWGTRGAEVWKKTCRGSRGRKKEGWGGG